MSEKSEISINNNNFNVFNINQYQIEHLPYSLRVLMENYLRNESDNENSSQHSNESNNGDAIGSEINKTKTTLNEILNIGKERLVPDTPFIGLGLILNLGYWDLPMY